MPPAQGQRLLRPRRRVDAPSSPCRGVALTEAGVELLAYADRILGLADEARSAVTGGTPKGQLHVRMPETLSGQFLPGLLAGFRERYPDCQLIFYRG